MNQRINYSGNLEELDEGCVVPSQVQLTKKANDILEVYESLVGSFIEKRPNELGITLDEVRRRIFNILLDADDNGVDITQIYKKFIDLEGKIIEETDRRKNNNESGQL